MSQTGLFDDGSLFRMDTGASDAHKEKERREKLKIGEVTWRSYKGPYKCDQCQRERPFVGFVQMIGASWMRRDTTSGGELRNYYCKTHADSLRAGEAEQERIRKEEALLARDARTIANNRAGRRWPTKKV